MRFFGSADDSTPTPLPTGRLSFQITPYCVRTLRRHFIDGA